MSDQGAPRTLLQRSEALLTSLQWAGQRLGGCETCDYGSIRTCPHCGGYESESEHYRSCELNRLVLELREFLGNG